jgi:SAM-dependent methyltransferase
MDAQQLAIGSEEADVVLLVFMLFHVPSPATCLREVHRVLKPEGSVGVVTWGPDAAAPGLSIWIEELDSYGAEPDPRDPSVMQQSHIDTPRKLRQRLNSEGFVNIRVWKEEFEYQWDPESLFVLQTRCGVASRRLESLSAKTRAECESRVRDRLGRLREEELHLRAEIVFGIADRPEPHGVSGEGRT